MQVKTDYLIIGGGIAGTTAAETIRERDPKGDIAIISAEPHMLYSRVLLPKYVRGAIRREQVFLRGVADYEKNNIRLFLQEEVAAIDTLRHEVRTRAGNLFSYRALLIAAGGTPKPWHVEGGNSVPVMRFQTIDDADAIREAVDNATYKEAVVVGGGFIALELINALVPRGFRVHMVLQERAFWGQYMDTAGSAFLEQFLEKHSIIIHRESQVLAATPRAEGAGVSVRLTTEKEVVADVFVVGVGLERNLALFGEEGIEVSRGVRANEFLETGAEGVWAAGDVAEYYDILVGRHSVVGNWTNAFLQGRTAGINMAAALAGGEKQEFRRVSSYALDVLGMQVTFLGHMQGAGEEGIKIITRADGAESYERLFIERTRLIGAILMNKFEDKKELEHLIAEHVDVSSLFGA